MAMMHTVHLWHRWGTLTEAVRRGTRVETPEPPGDQTEAFIAAMHQNASARAHVVAEAIDLTSRRRMLDIGGGSGAYSITFARANPGLEAIVFDRPQVIPIAERHIREAGLGARVTTVPGDFGRDPFPRECDLALLSAIAHMNSPAENLALLGKTFDALAPGGQVVIQDFILSPDRTQPRAGALFAINMLVNTSGGNSYTEPEYRAWLEKVGFLDVRLIALPGATGLVVGTRP